jgi:hypothetical protein
MQIVDHLAKAARDPGHVNYMFERALDRIWYRALFMRAGASRRCAFICGCGHSGTTLLATMFAEHPLIHVPLYETNAFAPPRHWKKLVDIERAAAEAGKPWFIEKTPRHVHQIDYIRAAAPGARFIVMVRDGRDVALSIGKRFGDLQAGVERWVADNEAAARQLGRPDVILLRYEDLVEDAERELRRICAFLGVDYTDQLLNYHQSQKLWHNETKVREADSIGTDGDEHKALRTWQVNQKIFDGRGRWKGELPEAIVAEFAKGRCAELMAGFGYLDADTSVAAQTG